MRLDTIGSILEALKVEGVKTGDIAKQIDGISEKPLRNALKQAGYMFSNSAPKGWHYVGVGDEPLDKSIFDYVKRGNTKVNKVSREIIQSNTKVESISPVIHPQFTREELTDLMTMLNEWRHSKKVEQPVPEIHKAVHERIKELPDDEKTRKTIVIDKGIGKRLDDYCKVEKVNKSDIIHLALLDFLDKERQ